MLSRTIHSFTMNKLLVLVASVSAALFSTAFAEEEKSPEELFDAYFKAEAQFDFKSIVDDMHPFTLKHFKATTLNIVEDAARKSSQEAVRTAFQGIKDLSELKDFEEKDFWVYVMENVYSYAAMAGKQEKKPLLIGKVEDGNFVHLLYRKTADLQLTDEVENFVAPSCLTLRKHEGHWRCYGFKITAVEKYVAWHAKIAPKGEEKAPGAEAPSPAPRSKPPGETE